MALTKKQRDFLNKKEKILENSKKEIGKIIFLTAIKVNNNSQNIDNFNKLLKKYLIA